MPLLAVLILLLIAGCNYRLPQNVLELASSAPVNGEKHAAVFSPALFVFSTPLRFSPGDKVTVDFEAVITSSAETLYVRPLYDLAHRKTYSIQISSLTPLEGDRQEIDIHLTFTTADGEREPNDQPTLSDTLRLGEIRDGLIGQGGGEVVDSDYFTIVPAGNDSFKVTATLFGAVQAYIIVSGAVQTISAAAPSLLFSSDTLTFRITNKGVNTLFNRGARYRLTVGAVR